MSIDPISGIEVATASARQLKEQRRTAAFSVLRYALQALDEGASLDQVIGACGFEYHERREFAFLTGHQSREGAFADWLGDELKAAIMSCRKRSE